MEKRDLCISRIFKKYRTTLSDLALHFRLYNYTKIAVVYVRPKLQGEILLEYRLCIFLIENI
jgi:hypothetical protein